MKYFLIAGENSGDLHGSNLMKSLKSLDTETFFRFVGGGQMEKVAGPPTIHYREVAVMGFWEVLKSIKRLNYFFNKCKKEIVDFQPDAVILIDFAGFNLRIARFAKGQSIPVFYYISPKIWAWNTSRALKIKKYVDRMFCILPFEKAFYKQFDWQVDYVGNPVLDSTRNFQANPFFRTGIASDGPLVAVLPGSRRQEVIAALPVLVQVFERFPEICFCIASVSSLDVEVYSSAEGFANVTVIQDDTYNLLCASEAAIVTSGTATLETALFKVPQVVTYRTSLITYAIAKRLVKVDYISLVNLIAGKRVIQELIQSECTADNVSAELERLLYDEGYRKSIISGYEKMRTELGSARASENTAALIVESLDQRRLKTENS